MLHNRTIAGTRFVIASVAIVGACSSGGSRAAPPLSPHDALVAQGAGLVQAQPCLVCHTTNGARAAGPTFRGLAGSKVRLADGRTVVADDTYLKESILYPDAKTVAGFPKGLMARVVKRNSLTTRQAAAIVAFIDTLSVGSGR